MREIMYTLNILHLSDIHCGNNFIFSTKDIKEYTRRSPEIYLADKLANDVIKESSNKIDKIIISGDLTDSGTKSQFKMAGSFIDRLIEQLVKGGMDHLIRDDVVIVPGNHDINFADNKIAYKNNVVKIPAYLCPEKLQNFSDFYQSFYYETGINWAYNVRRGFQLFRYPKNQMVIIALNSCSKISFNRKKAGGHISNDEIDAITNQLKEFDNFAIRLAVFHHNPFDDPEFGNLRQEDCLVTRKVNQGKFLNCGLGAIFHGHRHSYTLKSLINKHGSTLGKIACIGTTSLGSSYNLRAGDKSGYQLVNISISGNTWDIKSVSRVIDLSSIKADESGPGVFKVDQDAKNNEIKVFVPSKSTSDLISGYRSNKEKKKSSIAKIPKIYTPIKKEEISILAEKSKKMRKVKGSKDKIGQESKRVAKTVNEKRIQAQNKLDSLSIFRFLTMLDESRQELSELYEIIDKPVDKSLLECINIDIDLRFKIDKNELNINDIRAEFQKMYNVLTNPEIKGLHGRGIFPTWAFNREIQRCDYWTTVLAHPYHEQSRELVYKHIIKARELFDDSNRKDHDTNRHIILMLINLNQFSHARQALIEAIALNPNYSPYFVLLAELAIREMRYKDALNYLDKAKDLMGKKPVQQIDFVISYCHYYLGNYNLAIKLTKEGMNKWPHNTGFSNNYAFAKTREMLRTLNGEIWKDKKNAAKLLDSFLASIIRIGSNDVSHFNYALLLYWASQQGELDLARQILGDNKRANMQQLDDVVSVAFSKAKNSFLLNKDYSHAFFASYFAEKTKSKKEQNLRDKILDKWAWDADNFFAFRYNFNNRKRSLLTKDRNIPNLLEFGHLATLRRWMREPQPFPDMGVQPGGGYFIKWLGKGLVINPGMGFKENFERRGYSINEIDAILVTSSHYTAYEELTGLLELIKQSYVSRPKKERVAIYLEGSVLHRFPDLHIRSLSCILNPQVLPDHETFICDNVISIKSICPCDECGHGTEDTSIGDRIYNPPTITQVRLLDKKFCKKTIGIIDGFCASDEAFIVLKDCDYLLLNLGSVRAFDLFKYSINDTLKSDLMLLFQDDKLYVESFGINQPNDLNEIKNNDNSPICRKGEQTNLGIDKMLEIAEELKKQKGKAIIIGNIPVELGDKRHKLAEVLNCYYSNGPYYLTEDIGLVLKLDEFEILCEFEHKFVPIWNINEECIEGKLTGPVRHFCLEHRSDKGFGNFLSLDI